MTHHFPKFSRLALATMLLLSPAVHATAPSFEAAAAQPGVMLDMGENRIGIAGEARDLGGFITGARVKLGYTDYMHQDNIPGAAETLFGDKGYDSRLELTHASLGPLKGSFGVQVVTAPGAEASMLSASNSKSRMFFVREAAQFGRLNLSIGGRSERGETRADGGMGQARDTLSGFEAEGKYRVFEHAAGTLDVVLRLEQIYVRMDNQNIAPRQYGASLDYHRGKLGTRLDFTRVTAQERVAANDLPGDGYTMVNATVSYRTRMQGATLDWFVRGVNLLNEQVSNPIAFFRDVAPSSRGMQIGVRAVF